MDFTSGLKFLLIILVINDVMCRPSNHHNKNNQRLKKNNKKWWENPCGLPENSFSTDDSQVNDQNTYKELILKLDTVLNHIQTSDVFKRYKEVIEFNKNKFEWLPNIDDVKKQPIRKPLQSIKKLYKDLLSFAVTIECMKGGKDCKHKAKSVIHTDTSRLKMLEEIKYELKALLCEAHWILENNKISLPAATTPGVINGSIWANGSDETRLKVQDWGVLDRYIKFLTLWKERAQLLTTVGVIKKPKIKPTTTTQKTTTTTTQTSRKGKGTRRPNIAGGGKGGGKRKNRLRHKKHKNNKTATAPQ